MEQPITTTSASAPAWSALTADQILNTLNQACLDIEIQKKKGRIDWRLIGYQAYNDLRGKDPKIIANATAAIKELCEKNNQMAEWEVFTHGWMFAYHWHPENKEGKLHG